MTGVLLPSLSHGNDLPVLGGTAGSISCVRLVQVGKAVMVEAKMGQADSDS